MCLMKIIFFPLKQRRFRLTTFIHEVNISFSRPARAGLFYRTFDDVNFRLLDIEDFALKFT